MAEHAPLPWHKSQGGTISIMDAEGESVTRALWLADDEYKEAIVSLIVRACNSHEELLEVCKALDAWSRNAACGFKEFAEIGARMRAAIAKAEGRES